MKSESKDVSLDVRGLPGTKDMDRINSILNIFKGVEEYILDGNGTIVSSNLEAVTITGYEEWEVIGRHFSIFYSIEDQIRRVYEDHLEKATNLKSFSTTGVMIKKRNSPFWAKLRIVALLDGEKRTSGFRLTIQDSTHKMLYSHNLNLIKDEYLNIFNNPFIGIFKFRMSDYKVLMVNGKSEQIFGKDWNKTLLNRLFVNPTEFSTLIHELRTNKKIENFEFEITNAQGQRMWVSMSCKYFHSVGFAEGVIMDITDRKKEIERNLSLSSELESFIYHASHDLRSPITSIHGLVNLLMKESKDDRVVEYSRLIEGRVSHLDNMLRDIVEIAFNTAVPIAEDEINVVGELNAIAKSVAKGFPLTQYSIHVDHTVELKFYSDLTRFRSIVRNVVANAFKYTNPSQAVHQVNVQANVTENCIVILVRDNGIGIKPEFRDKIFSLFYKATENYTGNGLGLYIVKSMIEKLKGELALETEIGVGTNFRITIPNVKTVYA